MFPGWGGMLAAIPQGYAQGQQQQEQLAGELMRRKLLAQQYDTNLRQAPLQDQFLKAQIQHMQRPDIGQQKFAQDNAANVYGMGLPLPGATAMPQAPQGAQPQPFQAAQPMFPQGGAAPAGSMPQAPQGAQPGMQPNPFVQAPQMPQGQPPAMYQPAAPAAVQPQGAAPTPQAMPTADPIAQEQQQFMQQLQQRAQQVAAMPQGPQKFAAAQAIMQQQQQAQTYFEQKRKLAEHALEKRKTEEYRNAVLGQRAQGQEGQNTRSEQSSLTSRRDAEVHELSSLMLSEEQNKAAVAAIDSKYAAMGLKGGGGNIGQRGVDARTSAILEAHIPSKFMKGEHVSPDAIGQVFDYGGKQYKIMNNDGDVGFEEVK